MFLRPDHLPELRREKVSLSTELAELFFGKTLKKREWEALKLRCESYQAGSAKEWSGEIFEAYSQYFGFLSAVKVKSVLRELHEYGYLDHLKNCATLHLLDFGSGTLGATLGALDFFKANKDTLGCKVRSIQAIDADHSPIDWAKKRFENFISPAIIETKTSLDFAKPLTSNTLYFSVDVMNEMGSMNQPMPMDLTSPWLQNLKALVAKSDETALFCLLEPANKKINRNFLRLRSEIKEATNILLPCTHAQACPALSEGEWCHEERKYKAPSTYWNLVHSLGFERPSLNFSLLVLGKQKPKFKSDHSRVVSRPLISKGKTEKWLCSEGKRWKATVLKRRRAPETEDFFRAERGDVLDCSSTGLRPPA